MRKLTVHKKGYDRKGYTAKRGNTTYKVKPTHVSPTTFKIKDRGEPGRGPKTLPPMKKGGLGGKGFFKDKTFNQQKKIVFEKAKKYGEKHVMGELSNFAAHAKRTMPQYANRALKLKSQVAGSFIGRKKVKYPKGLTSKK